MAVVIAGELVLDRNETAALVRNMAHPDIETLRRRDAFLNDRDDIAFSFSDEGIIAECGSIASLEENQQFCPFCGGLQPVILGSDKASLQKSCDDGGEAE